MQINPYGEGPVRLAVSLVNNRPRTVTDLRERCENAGLSTLRVTQDDLAHTQNLLDEWTGIVDTPDEHARASRLNAMLATHTSHPRMTNHAGDGWHLHYREDHCSLGRLLAVLICVGTAHHLTGRGIHRLGRCGAPGCDLAYADFSRTGTQRYCSTRCANRDAVSRHRIRATSG